MMARSPRAPVPARRIAWSAMALQRVVGELQLDVVESSRRRYCFTSALRAR
ncbi:UNVERIFIED_ORG: hypothetical protein FHR35_007933 [Microbispora rosea subsp. rosea]